MGNNKKPIAGADEILSAGALRTRVLELSNGLAVRIRELSGRERFDLAEMSERNRWEVMVWMAHRGLVVPEITVEQMDEMQPTLVQEIAEAVMDMSGISESAQEQSGNESATVKLASGGS